MKGGNGLRIVGEGCVGQGKVVYCGRRLCRAGEGFVLRERVV